ncbi:type VI secretion system protein ImpH [Methylosinus sp. sav-2]|uniref:type VI secretion system baseplate subunit TssG n=1 Tax=unclassified Methylosinus TaxID=2624500 RepID=UPI0004B66E0D|nr:MULTISPECIES: type VI secretion system baseplate subunit TssG [unclassified Methylosinus]TDX62568.1 type VI secretion system protein ImpH [Methylosinus sp. sav-2]
MTYLEHLADEPWRVDFFDMMRRLERSLGHASDEAKAKPRIGDSASRKDETIEIDGKAVALSFGQDPWMSFPGSNVARVEWREHAKGADGEPDSAEESERLHVVLKFLGMLGPQGALPLSVTEEAHGWSLQQDPSFPHFLDIFNNRFLQLFYRAWADSRAIVQHDRPDCDRFQDYVTSTIGLGTPPYRGLAATPKGISVYAGLLGSRTKSGERLAGAIRGLFAVEVEIEQLGGGWLTIEEGERNRLGRRNCGLGGDLMLGAASFGFDHKFRIRIFVEDMKRYRDFLPTGEDCHRLNDLLFFYIGEEMEWDVEISLPATQTTPISLGRTGELGWTSWMAPNRASGERRCDARFDPAKYARAAKQRMQ